MKTNYKHERISDDEIYKYRWMVEDKTLPESVDGKSPEDYLFVKYHNHNATCECFYVEDGKLKSFFTIEFVVILLTREKTQIEFKQKHEFDDIKFMEIIEGSIFPYERINDVYKGKIFSYLTYRTVTTASL